MKYKKVGALCSLLLWIGICSGVVCPVFAQEAASPTEQQQPKAATRLKEVVVPAERVTPVEGAVTATVTAQDVQEEIASDVSEVLKTTLRSSAQAGETRSLRACYGAGGA